MYGKVGKLHFWCSWKGSKGRSNPTTSLPRWIQQHQIGCVICESHIASWGCSLVEDHTSWFLRGFFLFLYIALNLLLHFFFFPSSTFIFPVGPWYLPLAPSQHPTDLTAFINPCSFQIKMYPPPFPLCCCSPGVLPLLNLKSQCGTEY